MNNHKEIIEHIMAQEDAQEIICDIWRIGEEAQVGDLKVMLVAEEIVGYEEGTVFKDYIYDINGLLFLRADNYNSWSDYSDDSEFELLPAEVYQTTAYRVIK